MTYAELMRLKESPISDNAKASLFLDISYSAGEGILDARKDLDLPISRSVTRAVWRMQRACAIEAWKHGDDIYESWVPWWRKLLGRRRK